MLEMYRVKLFAYRFSRDRILKEYPQYNGNILAFFHDAKKGSKTILRDKLNSYMKSYVQQAEERGYKGLTKKYAKFYKVTFADIKREFERSNYVEREQIIEKCDNMMKVEQYEYKRIMEINGFAFYDHSGENIEKQKVEEQPKVIKSKIENQLETKIKISKPTNAKKVKFKPLKKEKMETEYKEPTIRETKNNKEIHISENSEIVIRKIPNIGIDIEI